MPEVPEVEGLAAFLRTTLAGARVADVQIAAISAVKTADPPVGSLAGRRVLDVRRSGKWLWWELGADGDADGSGAEPVYLAVHLSRAGWLVWRESPPATRVKMGRGPLALRLTFVDDDGQLIGAADLTEAGTQKRLAVHVVRDLAEVPQIGRLGPDPLDPGYTAAQLAATLREQGGRHLKSVLRDQSVLAGIGNAYSDEILHAARLSPAARSESAAGGAGELLDTIRSVLGEAVDRAVGSRPEQLKDGKRSHLRVHGRTGQPCEVCGDTIAEVASADSSHQYCPTCQTQGKKLADRRMSRLLK